jgi:nucleoid-associated protein YgaU
VKEGDSLWSISAELLGDGSRYKEISKLNSGVLNNDDELAVGMRLRIPAQ